MQGRSRTSRSLASCAFSNLRPQPEHTNFRLPRFRRTHSRSVFCFSLISCCHTRYPGHPSNFVSSLSRKLLSLPESTPPSNPLLPDLCQIPAQSPFYKPDINQWPTFWGNAAAHSKTPPITLFPDPYHWVGYFWTPSVIDCLLAATC